VLIAGDHKWTKEIYRLNLVKNECVRETDSAKGLSYGYTLAPILVDGDAYFVENYRKIHVYRISERKWEVVK